MNTLSNNYIPRWLIYFFLHRTILVWVRWCHQRWEWFFWNILDVRILFVKKSEKRIGYWWLDELSVNLGVPYQYHDVSFYHDPTIELDIRCHFISIVGNKIYLSTTKNAPNHCTCTDLINSIGSISFKNRTAWIDFLNN